MITEASGEVENHVTFEDVYVRAMQAPETLRDMRAVVGGCLPANHQQRIYKAILDKDPMKLMDRLNEAEVQWRETVAKLTQERAAESRDDEGEREVGELLEEQIKELL